VGVFTENALRIAENIGAQITGAVANAQLYSERVQVEEALRKSEDRFRDLYDNAPIGYHEYDTEGRITRVNRADLEMLGYSAEEMIGQPIWKFNVEAETVRDEILAKLSGTLPPARNLECTYRRKDGTTFPALCQDRFVLDEKGQIRGIRCAIQDITEQKWVEEALRESEARFRALFESSPLPKWLYDPASLVILAVNNAAVEHYGHSREEFMAMTMNDLRLPEEIGRVAVLQSTLPEHHHAGIWRHRKKDGTVMDVDIYTHEVILGRQRLRIATLHDITELKRASAALLESEQRFRAIFDSVNDAIFLLALKDGTLLDVNQRLCELFGYTIEEALQLHVEDLCSGVSPYTRDAALEWVKKAAQEGPQRFEWQAKDKAGKLFWVEVHLRRAPIGGEECLLGTAQDIAGRKRMEEEKTLLQEQLRQSQKMEAIGRLAGGIAHDFNNLLTVIHGYSQLSLDLLGGESRVKRNINQIRRAAERASDLTYQLLAFSRRQIMEMKVLCLAHLLKDLDQMLHRILGEDIQVTALWDEDLGKVRVDPSQMEQVLLNLVVNARDAMPAGGKLLIEMTNVTLDEAYARTHVGVTPGSYVMIAVTDTGTGMTSEVREHVFEPFFTTKEKGKGTGLGLSTVYGIVKQSGGNIWVYTEPGQGTSFKIYLPRVDDSVAIPEEMKKEEDHVGGDETILVIEDDKELRQIVRECLEQQGYRIFDACQWDEALNICEGLEEPIHLILTDVVMPEMSGPQMIERLLKIRSGFKVLYMSGYTDASIVHHGVLREGIKFIQKPFTFCGLGKKIRELLDEVPLCPSSI
jgi:two-component system cell cycle sensor histidine kinase/response regulator CckA